MGTGRELEPLLTRTWRTPTLERDLRDLGDVLGDPEEVLASIPERLWMRIDADGVAILRSRTGEPLLLIPASRITRLAVDRGAAHHQERVLNALDRWAMVFTWGMGRRVSPRIVVTVRRDDRSTAGLHLPATDTFGVSRWSEAFRPRYWPKLKRAQW